MNAATVTVDGVVFLTDLDWVAGKDLVNTVAEWVEGETTPLDDAVFMEQQLLKYIVGCDGLEDAEGTPLTQLTPDVIGGLEPLFIMRIFEKLVELAAEYREDGIRAMERLMRYVRPKELDPKVCIAFTEVLGAEG